MLIFLAIPYTQLCDDNLIVKEEYKTFFSKLVVKLKEIKCEYFLAHEREKWGEEYILDSESASVDFEAIKKCDLLCVIPGYPISGGVHVEMGYACAHNKKMNIFLKKEKGYSPMVTGIHCATEVNYYYYEEDFSDEIIQMIIDSIK